MTAASRRARSRKTEEIVAERLREVFPGAARRPASLPGSDILNTPGYDVEVKARRDLHLTAWLKQASDRAGTDLPVVVHRPDGYGPERIDQWPVTMRLADFVRLIRTIEGEASVNRTLTIALQQERGRHA